MSARVVAVDVTVAVAVVIAVVVVVVVVAIHVSATELTSTLGVVVRVSTTFLGLFPSFDCFRELQYF